MWHPISIDPALRASIAGWKAHRYHCAGVWSQLGTVLHGCMTLMRTRRIRMTGALITRRSQCAQYRIRAVYVGELFNADFQASPGILRADAPRPPDIPYILWTKEALLLSTLIFTQVYSTTKRLLENAFHHGRTNITAVYRSV